MRYDTCAAAMHGNLHVVPLIRSPGPRIGGDVGVMPVRLVVTLVDPIPGLRDAGTLCAQDYGLAVRHQLIYVKLQVLHL